MTDSFYAGGGIGLGPRPAVLEAEPYPAPLVSSRDGVEGPEKRAVRDMVLLAERCGWSVKVTYAKGWVPHAAYGTPGTEPRESLAVRMQRPGARMVAIYVDHGSSWSWDTLAHLYLGAWPRPYATVTAFQDGVFGKVQGLAPWRPPWVWPA